MELVKVRLQAKRAPHQKQQGESETEQRDLNGRAGRQGRWPIQPVAHHTERIVSVEAEEAAHKHVGNGVGEYSEPVTQMLAGQHADHQVEDDQRHRDLLAQAPHPGRFVGPHGQPEPRHGAPCQRDENERQGIERLEKPVEHEQGEHGQSRQRYQRQLGEPDQRLGDKEATRPLGAHQQKLQRLAPG